MIQTLCAAVVEKRERSVAELEEQGRLCAEDGGLGPCKLFKLFLSRDLDTNRNTFIKLICL